MPDLFVNHDRRVLIDEIEQFNHVRVAHSNATVAVRCADPVLVFRPVNVNEALARVGVVLFQSIEPENARHDQILRWRKRIIRPNRNAASKNRAAGHVTANFFRDTEPASRRLEAAFFGANAEARSGNRIRAQRFVASHHRKALIANGDVDLVSLPALHEMKPAVTIACG
jgi:hypothetical protein